MIHGQPTWREIADDPGLFVRSFLALAGGLKPDGQRECLECLMVSLPSCRR